ncbi:MAG: aminotransferase class IV [Microthrixaceae bacterium]
MSDDATAVVWIGGGLRDPATASVHWSDHGMTVGDGVFETIELRDGIPFALTRHLDRLDRSAEGLGLPVPDRAQLVGAVDAVSGAWGAEPGRLRITYTAGPGPMGSNRGAAPPTLIVVAAPMQVQTEPTDVLVVPFTRNERGALAGLKTTSYGENVVALALATDAGCSEALFANTRDELCEGTGSNVFVVLEDRLVTPPLDSGCLAGVTRALLLEALDANDTPALEAAVPMARLAEVSEAFLVSTGRHVQPVRRLGELVLASCPGPHTLAAAARWNSAYGELTDP